MLVRKSIIITEIPKAMVNKVTKKDVLFLASLKMQLKATLQQMWPEVLNYLQQTHTKKFEEGVKNLIN